MIEPIGLVGTLLAILQVSTKLVNTLYEVRCAAKGARHDVSLILSEIVGVRTIVERLVEIVDDFDVADSQILKSLRDPKAPLQLCLDEVTAIGERIESDCRLGSKLLPLKWSLKQKDLEQRLAALQRIKLTLQLALDTDNTHNMLQVLVNTSSLPKMSRELSNISHAICDTTQENRLRDLLTCLARYDQTSQQQEYDQIRSEGTGDWLLSHPLYLDWKATAGRYLWVNGNAGSGKTILCANIVQDLQTRCDRGKYEDLAYFYVDGSKRKAISVDVLKCVILQQLYSRGSKLPYWANYWLSGEVGHQKVMLSISRRFRSLLLELTHDLERFYIVIDGVDECIDAMGIDVLIEFLQDMMSWAEPKISIIISSRILEQLRQRTSGLDAVTISIESESANVDMKVALHHRLYNDSVLKRWPEALKLRVERALLESAQGSFHYVVSQLNSLRGCATLAAVKTKLSALPTSLEDHYSSELARVVEIGGVSIQSALRWIAFSFRPLSVAELSDAIAIHVGDDADLFFDEDLRPLDIDGLLDSCSSFLTTYRRPSFLLNNQDLFVKFSHFTVLEFLRSNNITTTSYKSFALEHTLGHSIMAKSCLVYLQQLKEPVKDETYEVYPLFEYSLRFWLQHRLASSDAHWSSPGLQKLIMRMFDEENIYSSNWLTSSAIDKPWLQGAGRVKSPLTPLYCAAYAGLVDVLSALLQRGVSPNEECGIFGNPLQAAAVRGHGMIVDMLIEAGADVDAIAGKYGSAMAGAAALGHAKVVKALLGKNATVQLQRKQFGTRRNDPLFLAVSNGHLEIVLILLEHGARDYHAPKAQPCTALHAAVEIGRLDIVKAMLQHEETRNLNARVTNGILTVHTLGIAAGQRSAARLGYKEILRELLSHGVDQHEALSYAAQVGDDNLFHEYLEKERLREKGGKPSDLSEPLLAAVRGKHIDLVQELLDAGVKPVAPALDIALRVADLDIAKLLIQRGGPPSAAEAHELLMSATWSRQLDFIQLLLPYGSSLFSCLQFAAQLGDHRAFQMVLDLGGDIHQLTPPDSVSILQSASAGGSVAIVLHLLDQGLDINRRTRSHPLTEAIRRGHDDVVGLLLSKGADVNASPIEDGSGDSGEYMGVSYGEVSRYRATETPLTHAIELKNENVAHLLIEMGADVSPKIDPYTRGTPLLFGIGEKMTSLVETLLQKGADPNQPGRIKRRSEPMWPLMLATELGDVSVMSMLVDAGAEINQQSEKGLSALHIACACPKTDPLNFLIQGKVADVTLRLQNGSLPIHSAASKGTAEHVKMLLDAGADLNARNDADRTPMHWAAEAVNMEVMELLLEYGIDVKVEADATKVTALDLFALTLDQPRYSYHMKDGTDFEKRASSIKSKLRDAMRSTAKDTN